MTLIDSLDSILMLYSYTGFPEHKLALFATRELGSPSSPGETPLIGHEPGLDENRPERINMRVKMNAMSGLSIVLTLMSILVAFGYVFLSTIVGLNLSHLQHILNHNHGPHWRGVRTLQRSGGGQGQPFPDSKVVERLGTGKRKIRICRGCYRCGFPCHCSWLVWHTLGIEKKGGRPKADLV